MSAFLLNGGGAELVSTLYQTATLRSRHAIVTEVTLEVDSSDLGTQGCLRRLEKLMVGTKYAAFDGLVEQDFNEVQTSILRWLKYCT